MLDRDRAGVEFDRGFNRRKGTPLVQAGSFFFSCDPIASAERRENALGFPSALDDLRLLSEVSAAPDGTLAFVGFFVLLLDGPGGLRFVVKAGVAGTIAGVAPVDLEIVGSKRDRHERNSSMATGDICHISLLHAARIPANS